MNREMRDIRQDLIVFRIYDRERGKEAERGRAFSISEYECRLVFQCLSGCVKEEGTLMLADFH